jgi:hypothetical protein
LSQRQQPVRQTSSSGNEQERNHQFLGKCPGNLIGSGRKEIGPFAQRQADSGGDGAGMMNRIRVGK